MSSPRPLRPLARAAAAVGLASAVLAACSAGGSDAGDQATSTVATTSVEATTTESPSTTVDRPTTTVGDRSGGEAITLADLRAILPSAQDVGTGWRRDLSADDRASDSTDFDAQCPDVAAFGDATGDRAVAAFTSATDQTLVVRLNPSAEPASADELAAYVEAIDACRLVTTDPDSGRTTTVSFDASTASDLGDQGIQILTRAQIGVRGGPQLAFTARTTSFRVGTVGINLTAQDGLVFPGPKVSPLDADLVDRLAADLERRVERIEDD